jgi:hypothetical protein
VESQPAAEIIPEAALPQDDCTGDNYDHHSLHPVSLSPDLGYEQVNTVPPAQETRRSSPTLDALLRAYDEEEFSFPIATEHTAYSTGDVSSPQLQLRHPASNGDGLDPDPDEAEVLHGCIDEHEPEYNYEYDYEAYGHAKPTYYDENMAAFDQEYCTSEIHKAQPQDSTHGLPDEWAMDPTCVSQTRFVERLEDEYIEEMDLGEPNDYQEYQEDQGYQEYHEGPIKIQDKLLGSDPEQVPTIECDGHFEPGILPWSNGRSLLLGLDETTDDNRRELFPSHSKGCTSTYGQSAQDIEITIGKEFGHFL